MTELEQEFLDLLADKHYVIYRMTKEEMFQAGAFICPPPPVYHYNWNTQDWITWIDNHGRWKSLEDI